MIFEPGVGHRVVGEVFEVGDRALAGLDELEGAGLPLGYRRVAIAVERVAGGEVLEAWAYVKDRATIDVIHSDMLEEYSLDPRYVTADRRRR